MADDVHIQRMAHIALGSNMGDRQEHLRAGLAGLEAMSMTRLVAVSSFIETPAVTTPRSAPQPPYLNAAATIVTGASPAVLLAGMLAIERSQGRERSEADRWASRTLDLDLLLYDERVIETSELCVPHPRMHERLFVLEPLAEIAPEAMHPVLGMSIASLLAHLEDEAHQGRQR